MERFGTLIIPEGYDPARISWVLGSGPRFADALRATRVEECGLSQERFVAEFNNLFGQRWVQTMLTRIETHRREVKLDEALALCEFVKKPLSALIGEPPGGQYPEA